MGGIGDNLTDTAKRAALGRTRKSDEQLVEPAPSYPRSVIEATLQPFVALDPEGKIRDANQAALDVTGLPRRALIGLDFSDCFTEPENAREAYRRALIEGVVVDHPLTIRHTSGRLTDVCYNASVYKDPEGHV